MNIKVEFFLFLLLLCSVDAIRKSSRGSNSQGMRKLGKTLGNAVVTLIKDIKGEPMQL
jgi:hypothetical protein